jgi:hypothetical protein
MGNALKIFKWFLNEDTAVCCPTTVSGIEWELGVEERVFIASYGDREQEREEHFQASE